MEFKYTAQNKETGLRISNTMYADDVTTAVMRLSGEGVLPLKIKEVKSWQIKLAVEKFLRWEKVSPKELSIFTRQLAATLGAGLLLTEALESTSDDLENQYFQGIIHKIKEDIMAGVDFSIALSKYPTIFPKSYCQVVKSGEATGRLHVTVLNLALYLEKIELIKGKVKSAIQYPLFIFYFACVILTGMVMLLIPKFKEIFEQSGAKLPWLTRMVVGLSDFMIHYFIWILVGLLLLIVAFKYVVRMPKVTRIIGALQLRIPLFGKEIIHKSLIANFCRTFSFLLLAGVEISTSLDISGSVVGHDIMTKAVNQVRDRVMSGATLSSAIREHKIFPRLVSRMAAVGEKSGRLTDMFHRTAEYYENEMESTVQGVMSLIEPIMISVVGGIVGIVVVALYLPIFKIATLVK